LERNTHYRITELNAHRLLLAGTVVAAKFHDDDFYSNAYYAKIGGVSNEEMNVLEVEFLKLLDWRADVSEQAYASWCNRLHSQATPRPIANRALAITITKENDAPMPVKIVNAIENDLGSVVGDAAKASVGNVEETSTATPQKPVGVSVGAECPESQSWRCKRRLRMRSSSGRATARRRRMCGFENCGFEK